MPKCCDILARIAFMQWQTYYLPPALATRSHPKWRLAGGPVAVARLPVQAGTIFAFSIDLFDKNVRNVFFPAYRLCPSFSHDLR